MSTQRHCNYDVMTSSLQVTASFRPLATDKMAYITLSFTTARNGVLAFKKNYLHILVCKHGVFMAIKMAESNYHGFRLVCRTFKLEIHAVSGEADDTFVTLFVKKGYDMMSI